MAQHDHPHQRRPAQGKPPRPTSVGHLALRRGGAPVHRAWPSLSRKSWAVTSWPSAPGGAAPSLGSRTRVPALHRRSTRNRAVAAPRLHKRPHDPGCGRQRWTLPCLPLRGCLLLPWTAAGHKGSVSRPLQTWRGRGGSERGHRAPERRRAGASSPARLTTRDRTPLETQGCCPLWPSAQPRGRLPSTAQQVLPCAATGKPDSKSPAEARPAPRNARGSVPLGVTTRGGVGGTDPCSRSGAHRQELSDTGNGGPRAE